MLLSFSLPEMLPSIAVGLIQSGKVHAEHGDYRKTWAEVDRVACQAANPGDVVPDVYTACHRAGGVKRQTIRAYDWKTPNIRSPYSRIMPGDQLDIWWKCRTKEKFKIGAAKCIAVHEVEINRTYEGCNVMVIIRQGRSSLTSTRFSEYIFNDDREALLRFAKNDGFKSVDDFTKYFLPNPGDIFRGVLIAW